MLAVHSVPWLAPARPHWEGVTEGPAGTTWACVCGDFRLSLPPVSFPLVCSGLPEVAMEHVAVFLAWVRGSAGGPPASACCVGLLCRVSRVCVFWAL